MISLRGAKLHNLKNISVLFKKNAINVVCGPSGCGKSTLVLNTLHGECKRRYLETLSPFAVRVLGGKKYIPLDDASGLMPSIALGPSRGEAPERETALSLAEIDLAFHTLWLSGARPVCPICGQSAQFYSREEIVFQIAALPEKSRLQFIAPLFKNKNSKKNETLLYKNLGELAAIFLAQGFSRAFVNGDIYSLADLKPNEAAILPKTFEIITDRIIIREGVRTRIAEAVDACLNLTHDYLEIETDGARLAFSTIPRCPNGHDSVLTIPEVRHFSPYSVFGACKTCGGKGISDSEICPTCRGLRLLPELLNSKFQNAKGDSCSYSELLQKSFVDFKSSCQRLFSDIPQTLSRTADTFFKRLDAICDLGIGYLSPARGGQTLSGGELERLRLVSAVTGYLDGMLFCLDEPAAGLHQNDVLKLLRILNSIKERGNTIVLIDHNPELIVHADYIIEMGPGAGENGGNVLFTGTAKEVLQNPNSPTANWIKRLQQQSLTSHNFIPPQNVPTLSFKNFSKFDIQPINADFPIEHFSVITGPSGCGKSTLLFYGLVQKFKEGAFKPFGIEELSLVTAGTFQGNKRSTIASAIQLTQPLRELFASLPESKIRGYTVQKFSTHIPGGRCETCKGEGFLQNPNGFEESERTECPICLGKRFRDEILEIRFKSLSIADIFNLSIDEAVSLFSAFPKFYPKLKTLADTGLGYLRLGQTTSELSGGERARLRLSLALKKNTSKKILYLFDEPARGLHEKDIQALLKLFRNLCAQKHTLIAIEHAPDFIYAADYVLNLESNFHDD